MPDFVSLCEAALPEPPDEEPGKAQSPLRRRAAAVLIDLVHDRLHPTKATVHCRCGERQRPTKGHFDYAVSASRICEFPKLRIDSRVRGLPRTALFLCNLGCRFLSLSRPKHRARR
jgi:hypothetical protein